MQAQALQHSAETAAASPICLLVRQACENAGLTAPSPPQSPGLEATTTAQQPPEWQVLHHHPSQHPQEQRHHAWQPQQQQHGRPSPRLPDIDPSTDGPLHTAHVLHHVLGLSTGQGKGLATLLQIKAAGRVHHQLLLQQGSGEFLAGDVGAVGRLMRALLDAQCSFPGATALVSPGWSAPGTGEAPQVLATCTA
jgi:hypothetical protein